MLIFFKSWRESFWLCLTLGSCKLRNYIPSLQAQRRQISNRLSNWPPPSNLVSNFIGSIMGGKKYWPIFKLVGKQKGQKHSEMTAPFLCVKCTTRTSTHVGSEWHQQPLLCLWSWGCDLSPFRVSPLTLPLSVCQLSTFSHSILDHCTYKERMIFMSICPYSQGVWRLKYFRQRKL